ncbi:MAG TPA: methyltransferase domain-containing protein [Vicinamibacterales bacterium]|nr:methyltransferase domain-containing protein [Vicinamibacterales bacterium]
MESTRKPDYVLGNAPDELTRLDRQAAAIGPATRFLLQAAGIGPGMRVLDLGTGLGHVARMISELVGPSGAVVGVERSGEALAIARERTEQAGATNVSFLEGDITSWRDAQRFDAIVERLVLFHVADPVTVVRHHRQNLRPEGRFVAIDFDIGAARSEPPLPLIADALRWILAAFSAGGASPRIGARLGVILEQAGLKNVTTFGVQPYMPPHNASSANLISSVVRSLAPAILQHGIATAEEMDLSTLEQRIAQAVQRANAVVLMPAVAGAWGLSS